MSFRTSSATGKVAGGIDRPLWRGGHRFAARDYAETGCGAGSTPLPLVAKVSPFIYPLARPDVGLEFLVVGLWM